MTRNDPLFSDRLAYLIWLRHLLTGECPGNAEIGRAIGVTGPAVTGWLKREDAPDKRRVIKGLLEFFGVPDSEEWLISGGDAPRPDLWAQWWAVHAPQARRVHHGKPFKGRGGNSSSRTA